jgi:hypothetical protein
MVRGLHCRCGMKLRAVRVTAFLSLITGLFGCSAADDGVPTERMPGTSTESFSTAPSEPNHEEITATALSFLRPEILTALEAANASSDAEFFTVNANHFDDCNFTGGAAVVRTSQAEAVAQLDPSAAPGADSAAIPAFGHALHAVQDFYAHTNWIELGGQVLVDGSLGAFPALSPYSTVPSTGFVIVQGNKPKHAALSREDSGRYPTSAIVTVKLDKTRAPGLISGTVDYEPGNFCPDSVAMTHDELNKDRSTNVGRSQQFEAAKAIAILQTAHEWCRLRELTRAQWGDAGVARLDSWVASGATPPICQ